MSRLVPIAALAALALATAFGARVAAPPRPIFPDSIKGITISTHGSGQDWALADPMRETMADLKTLGTDWVAIHPYARISRDGEVGFRPTPPDHVTVPIRVAHEQGLRILIKPHLAYWGSGFAWRGEIAFADEAALERFWQGYSDWIVGLAAAASDADGFVVGTELDLLLDEPERWRTLIARVREVTDAPLTYAANWSDFERVEFWHDLDAIGIQGYFPLAESDGPHSEEQIRAGWKSLAARLSAYSKRQRRPVLFAELGYPRTVNAAVEPWIHRRDDPEAPLTQQSCMRIALETIEAEPALLGAFLWKWFPEPHPVGRDFQLATDGMRAVIAESWR